MQKTQEIGQEKEKDQDQEIEFGIIEPKEGEDGIEEEDLDSEVEETIALGIKPTMIL